MFILALMMRLLLILLFISPPLFLNGQTDTGAAPLRKGPLKSWRLDGISLSVGRVSNKSSGDLISIFENTTATAYAKNKISSDIININGYERKEFEPREHLRAVAALRFTLKPRVISLKRFASFTEISAALVYAVNSGQMLMAGESNSASGDTFNHYITSYYFSNETVGLDLGYTVQTPGLFGYFAFYSGPRIYGAIPFNAVAYSSVSQQYSHTHATYPQATYYDKDVFSEHSDFSRPVFNAGLSVPIGIKLNIFPRWNLFFEYIFNYNATYYSNSYKSAVWYRGLELGFRYRFVKKGNQIYERKKGPAPAPEPFY